MSEWNFADEYLPEPLKDFHDQKDVFKALWAAYMVDSNDEVYSGLTWVTAHCFVIDKFLWFMAKHGWKLQRWKTDSCAFVDIGATVSADREKSDELLRAYLDQDRD